jgi:hypothetical protein
MARATQPQHLEYCARNLLPPGVSQVFMQDSTTPVAVREWCGIQCRPARPPLWQVFVHQRYEPLVMMSADEMCEFVD